MDVRIRTPYFCSLSLLSTKRRMITKGWCFYIEKLKCATSVRHNRWQARLAWRSSIQQDQLRWQSVQSHPGKPARSAPEVRIQSRTYTWRKQVKQPTHCKKKKKKIHINIVHKSCSYRRSLLPLYLHMQIVKKKINKITHSIHFIII